MAAKFIEGEVCHKDPAHGRKRYASNGQCVECAKLAARWHQKNNPEAHQERVKRYSENNPHLIKGIHYSKALRLLANYGPQSDAVAFVAELFGKAQDEVMRDRDEFLRRNLNKEE